MAKRKRKLTKVEKQAKKENRERFEWIFVRGKQKRIPRPPTIDGLCVDEFIRRNADPIWLHQGGLWEYMDDGSEDEQQPDSTFDTEQDRTASDSRPRRLSKALSPISASD